MPKIIKNKIIKKTINNQPNNTDTTLNQTDKNDRVNKIYKASILEIKSDEKNKNTNKASLAVDLMKKYGVKCSFQYKTVICEVPSTIMKACENIEGFKLSTFINNYFIAENIIDNDKQLLTADKSNVKIRMSISLNLYDKLKQDGSIRDIKICKLINKYLTTFLLTKL